MPKGNETILVVDDEEMLRTLAVQILASLGYKVVEARDGINALDVCKDFPQPIDLVLSDVLMPELQGPEFVDKLRKMRDDFKVLYITGFSKDTYGDAFDGKPKEQQEELLPKPYTPQQLAQLVRTILDEEHRQAA